MSPNDLQQAGLDEQVDGVDELRSAGPTFDDLDAARDLDQSTDAAISGPA